MLFVPERRVRLLVRPHARAGVEICDITSSQQPVTVRPHARAGVEMSPVMRILMLSAVRPHARAGVEMMRVPSQAKRMRVRPHARAGVEMSSRRRRSPATLFALTRGRELNVPMASSITSCCSSPLTRRRRGCEGMRRRGRLFVAGCGCALLGVFDFWGAFFSRCWFRCFCRSCCLYFGRRQGDVGGLLVWGLSLARGRMGRLMPGDRSNTHSR